MANPNNFNWNGESSEDDDDELEQLAAAEEKAPLDFASLLKGEKADEGDSAEKSIAEIFGISKSEDEEKTELSTFDKIIGRTLEEDINAASATTEEEPATHSSESSEDSEVAETSESAQTAPEVEVVEPIEPVPPDQPEKIVDSQDSSDAEPDEEPTAADAVSTKTVYENSHEYPLAGESSKDSPPEASAKDSGEEPADFGDQERGRADEKPSREVPTKPAESVEPASAQQPESQPAPTEAEAPDQPVPESEPEPQTAPEVSAAAAEPEPEQAEAAQPEPEQAVDSEPAESAEETDRNAKEFMGNDEGSEDEQSLRPSKPATAEQEPDSTGADSKENLPEPETKQSPAGGLALLLGVREIFKRRKGDKQNRQEQIKGDQQNQEALEEHESLEEQAKQELKARQAQAESDIDQLKQAQDNSENSEQISFSEAEKGAEEFVESQATAEPETVETSQAVAAEQELDPIDSSERTVENIYENLEIDQDQLDAEPSADNSQVREYETIRSLSGEGEAFSQHPDYVDDELEKKAGQRLETEYLSGVEQSTVFNNQEIDGELALDSRHENVVDNKIPDVLPQDQDSSVQRPAHISEVLKSSQHHPQQPEETVSNLSVANDYQEPISKNQQLRDSIKAGVTIGVVIAVLAGIFFIFK